jgi:hypothetical protein
MLAARPSAYNVQSRSGLVEALLCCGIVAAVLYILLDATCALLYDGYSYRDQTISELSAIDAPTRTLWVVAGYVYTFVTLAAGAGILIAAGGRRSLQVIAGGVLLVGAIGLVGWPFAAMHQREVLAAGGDTLSDTMHLVFAGINSMIFVASIILGMFVFRGRFRAFTIVMFIAITVGGFYTWLESPDVATNDPTPWLGIAERITVFGSMLWIGVLGIRLMLEARADETTSKSGY